MSLKNLILLLLFLAIFTQGRSQYWEKNPYHYEDSVALSIRKRWCNPYNLALKLTQNLTTDEQKARAIYRWITANIAYDCKAYHNRNRATEDSQKILKRRKAICGGYSELFKTLCNHADIDCKVIVGYSRTDLKKIGKRIKKPEHAWNAVWFNDQWHLVDVTWGSGETDERVRFFKRRFKSSWFLSPSDLFLRSHYPSEEQWKLTYSDFDKEDFEAGPIVRLTPPSVNISDFEPQTGTIFLQHNTTIQFKFQFDSKRIPWKITIGEVPPLRSWKEQKRRNRLIRKGKLTIKPLKTTQSGYFRKEGDWYVFDYQAYKKGRRHIYILLEGVPTMGYKLVVK